jgi:hypothetical protein
VAMVRLSAMLLLAVFVIFEIIASEYYVANVGLVAALAVLALPTLAKSTIDRINPAFMKIAGYVIAFSGVIELLDDVRFDVLDEFMAIVGALIAYAAYVMAFLGARGIKD